jgi:hypothetical protein
MFLTAAAALGVAAFAIRVVDRPAVLEAAP